MGLPYVSDAAVSKHLASFIRQHIHDFEKENPTASTSVDAILFNGGVFQPKVLQDRVISVMRPWFAAPDRDWNPLVLTVVLAAGLQSWLAPSLTLAVNRLPAMVPLLILA